MGPVPLHNPLIHSFRRHLLWAYCVPKGCYAGDTDTAALSPEARCTARKAARTPQERPGLAGRQLAVRMCSRTPRAESTQGGRAPASAGLWVLRLSVPMIYNRQIQKQRMWGLEAICWRRLQTQGNKDTCKWEPSACKEGWWGGTPTSPRMPSGCSSTQVITSPSLPSSLS